MSRLTIALIIAITLALIWLAQQIDDKRRVQVEATPAVVLECRPLLPNPCATTNCTPRIDTKRIA